MQEHRWTVCVWPTEGHAIEVRTYKAQYAAVNNHGQLWLYDLEQEDAETGDFVFPPIPHTVAMFNVGVWFSANDKDTYLKSGAPRNAYKTRFRTNDAGAEP
jgi:hypothetical protein